METTEKKPKNGFDRLKKKYAMLLETHKEEMAKGREQLSQMEAERNNAHSFAQKWRQESLKKQEELQTAEETIRKQGTKISTLTADLANARGEAREYRNKFEEAVRRMGWLRRWWYGYSIPQFTDEDHWHD